MKSVKSMATAITLLLVGGFGSVAVLSQPWVTATLVEPSMPAVEVSRTGATIHPTAFAAAWLTIACAIAFYAFGPGIRRFLGAILVLCGLTILFETVRFLLSDTMQNFPPGQADQALSVQSAMSVWILIPFALCVILSGIATLLWSKSWSTLSAEQSGSSASDRRSDWDSFDDGDDPTAEGIE